MQPGLAKGQTAEVEVIITPHMCAQFPDEGVVHNLYSTSALVHHMEWAARKTILAYLEEHEAGMGSHVEVSHMAMTPVGLTVRVKATVTAVHDKKIFCDVDAWHAHGKIARGKVVQTVVDRQWLKNKINEITDIDETDKGERHGKTGCAL